MGHILQVNLPDDLDAEVKSAVARGEFASESEAICSALSDWRAERLVKEMGVDELRRLWDEGVASGRGEGLTMDEIKARARQKARG